MEDITRIERVEGFVGQLGKGRYSFHVSETRLRLPHTSPATLFISKDATPPKVRTEEEVTKALRSILSDLCDDGVLLSYANVRDQFIRSAAAFGITL